MDELDRELRLAVFAHVGRLRDAGGGVVRSERLNDGLIFQGKRVPIWNQQKGIYKPVLLGPTGAALSIQTSYKSPYDDGEDPTHGRFLYRYRGQDPMHPDNVALRRCFQLGLPLLYLVGVQPGVYQPEFPFYVVGDRPADLAFELMSDALGDLSGSFDRPVLENEALKAYATRTVRQRLHQRRFRYLVLNAYRSACAMCRLRHEPLLDAAHILEDRDDRGRPEVPNGLALCKIHHSAYDSGILGVDPDYHIHVRQTVLDEADGPMLRHGLQELHGSTLHVPRRPEQRPNPEYLAERFRYFEAA